MDTAIRIFEIIVAGGLVTMIIFFVNRHDSRKGTMRKIEEKVERQERDSVRTQLLLLMSNYSDDTHEIMQVAQHYFCDLEGNWYMTTLFNKFLKKNNIADPDWLQKDKSE